MLCDIAGFSEKPSHAQQKCVTKLDELTRTTSLLSSTLADDHNRYVLNCIGDGFVLILTHPKVQSCPDLILRFVRDLLAALNRWNRTIEVRKEPDLRIEVRIGIHTGDFYMGVQLFGAPNAIGTGVNIAARIAGVGDPGHVLVSEGVRAKLVDTERLREKNSNGRLRPVAVGRESLTERPSSWQVSVKHGVELSLAPWHMTHDRCALGLSTKPKRVMRFEEVELAIFDQLTKICRGAEGLFAESTKVRPQKLGFRLSILVVRGGDNQLVCTPLRVQRFGDEIRRLAANSGSEVRYDIALPKGMPAHALSQARRDAGVPPAIVFQHDMPKYRADAPGKAAARDRAAYEAKLQSVWQLPPELTRRLARKARTYFGRAIPALGHSPFGVLMVDSDEPLSALDESEGKRLATTALSGDALAALSALMVMRFLPG